MLLSRNYIQICRTVTINRLLVFFLHFNLKSLLFFFSPSEQGIYVIGFSFPVVPKGKARIRVQISASHTDQDIDRAVDAFVKIGKELRVIG